MINKDGKSVMSTEHISCFPTKEQLSSMVKAGYKFKIDGKPVTKKKIEELKK